MDLIKDDIKTVYRKYLGASLAGSVVMSIYSFIDTIAIGQSEGPLGAASMAVINPLFSVIVFFALLCGVGGAVLYGNARGQGREEKANALFTAAVALMAVLTVILWLVFGLFHDPILTAFGADEDLLPKVMEYAGLIIAFIPAFIIPIFLGTFIRNDGAPGLAMAAVITGGCVNIFGDWFFVFPLGMGMRGAALATVLGTVVQMLVMCAHFFTKKCTLKIVKPNRILPAIQQTLVIGFSSSVLELGMAILGVIINNQIMKYGSTNDLAVYGVVATIAALFQALYGGVGQAIQPIVSANCGAGFKDRIRETWKRSVGTVLLMGVIFALLGELFPKAIINLFVEATPEVLAVAPGVMRPYFIMFIFAGINVLATYHMQSILRGNIAIFTAIMRGLVLSGALVIIMPAFMGIMGVWTALPVADAIICAFNLWYIYKRT